MLIFKKHQKQHIKIRHIERLPVHPLYVWLEKEVDHPLYGSLSSMVVDEQEKTFEQKKKQKKKEGRGRESEERKREERRVVGGGAGGGRKERRNGRSGNGRRSGRG